MTVRNPADLRERAVAAMDAGVPRPEVARAACNAFVERALAPALCPGHAVVLDNLSVHTSARAREAVEAAGCRLVFPPTSSPDLNPSVFPFATRKRALRRVGPRSFDAVVGAVGAALAAVTPANVRAFSRAAGYAA